MQWEQPTCPECGEEVSATLEVVQGEAIIARQPDGSFEYQGDTRINWDSQKTVTEDGKDVLVCDNGHEWHTARLPEPD